MEYATFTYYEKTFKGNLIPKEEFPRLAERAKEYVDSITAGIIPRLQGVPEEVKKAVCAIAEKHYSKEQRKDIVTEKVDKYSVTYKENDIPFEKELFNIAKMYLGYTGLLYRGC